MRPAKAAIGNGKAAVVLGAVGFYYAVKRGNYRRLGTMNEQSWPLLAWDAAGE